MAFQWKTDEGGEIEEPPPAPAGARSRRWLFLLIALLILSLASFVTWRRLQSRAAFALSLLEADVRSSQRLLARATAQHDEELLVPLLSGSNPQWTATQRELFADGLFLEQAPRVLGLEPLDHTALVTDVAFSPELSEATVTIRHAYTVTNPHSVRETVQLEQKHVFRRGDQRWLLSPRGDDFWGEWRFAGGSDVRLAYPERDESFALELLSFLREKVVELCTIQALDCPQTAGLSVHLESDLQTVGSSAGTSWLTGGSAEVVLPTPSLIGRPLDEKGKAVLLRAYAARGVAALNTHLIKYDCCSQALFYESLQYAQLRELGLHAWPLSSDAFLAFVERPLSRQRLSELWWAPEREPPTPQEQLQVLAFLDFLLQDPETTIVALQQGVAQGYGFRTWVYRLTAYDPGLDQNEFEEAWRAFVLAQANSTQREVKRPEWPEQQLVVLCRSFMAQQSLYAVDLPQGELEELAHLFSRSPAAVALPGDEGMIVFNVPSGDPAVPVELWRPEQMTQLEADLQPAITYSPDPQGRYLSVWRADEGDGNGEQAVLLDSVDCIPGAGCPLLAVPGLPVWSQDGEQFLLIDPDQGLILGERQTWAMEVVDREAIRSPFWIDEGRYGYVAGDGRIVQLRVISSPEEKTLHMVDMQPVARASEEGRNWQFAEILPVTGDQLLVSLTLPRSRLRHFFLVSDAGGPQQATEPILYAPLHSLSAPDALVSPDGRWLFAHLVAGQITDARFVLYDLDERQLVLDINAPYFVGSRFNDWSSDGRWMARLGRRFVEVMAPIEDGSGELFRHFISTGNLQCSSVAWIDGKPDAQVP